MIMNILTWLVIGIIVGALARLVLPGRQAIGWVPTIAIGIVAAIVGGLVTYQLLGVDNDGGIAWIPLIVSVALGALGVALYAGMIGGRHRTRV